MSKVMKLHNSESSNEPQWKVVKFYPKKTKDQLTENLSPQGEREFKIYHDGLIFFSKGKITAGEVFKIKKNKETPLEWFEAEHKNFTTTKLKEADKRLWKAKESSWYWFEHHANAA